MAFRNLTLQFHLKTIQTETFPAFKDVGKASHEPKPAAGHSHLQVLFFHIELQLDTLRSDKCNAYR